ncbi:hypothetical protein ACUSIJ_26490 [Pseudochelatococcus sp. B33]
MRSLTTYDDWKYCITETCRIPLTAEFIASRLRELRNGSDHNTQKFIRIWGEPHRQRVITWFEQAEAELAQNSRR